MKYFLFILTFLSPILLNSQNNLPDRGEVFRNDVVPRIDIQIAQEDLDFIFAEGNEYSYVEHPATFIFNNGTVLDTVENVGFRLRGNTSRQADKKSFKVSFNSFESQKYRGLQKMNLNGEHNDPSVSRARLAWDMLRWTGVPGARANHVELYVNGDYFGIYANIEHIDDNFIETYFGNDEGNLYKNIYPCDMAYKGTDPDAYKEVFWGRRAYQLRTNTERDDYADFAELVDIVNNTPIEDLECELESVLNVENFLKCIAFDVLIGNWDGPHYNKNNFYLYHNAATGKFEYIPYDLDNTLGIDWLSRDWGTRDMYDWAQHGDTGRPFYNRTLEVPAFRERYSVYMQEFLEEFFNEETLFPYVDAMRDQVAPFIADDPFYSLDYGFSESDFEDSFDEDLDYFQTDYAIKDYITTRQESSEEQLVLVNTAPIILEVKNNYPLIGEDLIISAQIQDENSDFSVQLCYSNPNNPTTICEPMLDNGLNGDIEANDGIYIYNLGVFTSVENLAYYVETSDNEGLINRIPSCDERFVAYIYAESDLVINEIMASNLSTIADETGSYEDWIELYNRGTEAIDLGDYFLTDNFNIPGKWQLPKTTLAAGDYLLVWADNDPEDSVDNHASFKLSAGGEEVGLFQKVADAFTAIDLVPYEELTDDESYARVPNGTGEFASHFSTPNWNNDNMTDTVNIPLSEIWTISPNPNNGNFSIQFDTENAERFELEIYNVQGLKLYSDKAENGNADFNISVPAGVYFVKMKNDIGRTAVRKMVVE
jgi:spore coat protein CotH